MNSYHKSKLIGNGMTVASTHYDAFAGKLSELPTLFL
jgi:hypothetical protein